MTSKKPGRAVLTTLFALTALLAGCTDSTGDGETTAPPSSTSAPATTAPPTTAPPEAAAATAWFVVDTRAGLRLSRDDREPIADQTPQEAVQAAVETMIAGPADPDLNTTWNPDTEVLAVDLSAGAITVDLSEDARTANVGSEAAGMMIQQLVWTATEAAEDPTAGVVLLIEGEPAGELWGAVSWDGPVVRPDPLGTRTLVQLATPLEGQVLPAGPVTVSGDAAAFEAVVPWRVLTTDGTEVDTGFTMTSEGQTFAPFSFQVDLPAGEYIIEISEDDPSGGAGGTPTTDTRSFVVE